MKNLFIKIVASFLVAAFTLTFAGNSYARTGKELYKLLLCDSCHGEDGKGILCKKDKISKRTGKVKCRKGDVKRAFKMYPKLAGQQELYAYNQIKDIFNKKRTAGLSASMYDTVVKAGLLEKYNIKDKDYKKIAKYLSKVK